MRIGSPAQQNVLICIITDPAGIEPNPEPIGGYRAQYLWSAATVRDASRGSREPPGAAMASILAPT